MEVILLERIDKLGDLGATVRVKNGYARNFLLPRGKALRANKGNLERFEKQRQELEERNTTLRDQAKLQAEKIDGETFILIRQAGESGQLYGSVTPRDIVNLLAEHQCAIGRDQVLLVNTIKMLGIHQARIRLHPEIIAAIRLNVARTEEDASGQLSAAQAAQSIAEAAKDIFEEGAAPDVEQIKQEQQDQEEIEIAENMAGDNESQESPDSEKEDGTEKN